MIDMISPYALLKASKPKPPAAYVTDYDLYSAAQKPSAFPVSPPLEPETAACPAPAAQAQRTAASMRPTPGKTHYIADIQNRHSRALRRTQLTGAAIAAQPPSPDSAQLPEQ